MLTMACFQPKWNDKIQLYTNSNKEFDKISCIMLGNHNIEHSTAEPLQFCSESYFCVRCHYVRGCVVCSKIFFPEKPTAAETSFNSFWLQSRKLNVNWNSFWEFFSVIDQKTQVKSEMIQDLHWNVVCVQLKIILLLSEPCHTWGHDEKNDKNRIGFRTFHHHQNANEWISWACYFKPINDSKWGFYHLSILQTKSSRQSFLRFGNLFLPSVFLRLRAFAYFFLFSNR